MLLKSMLERPGWKWSRWKEAPQLYSAQAGWFYWNFRSVWGVLSAAWLRNSWCEFLMAKLENKVPCSFRSKFWIQKVIWLRHLYKLTVHSWWMNVILTRSFTWFLINMIISWVGDEVGQVLNLPILTNLFQNENQVKCIHMRTHHAT